jgi:hypothetical protein
MTMRILLATLVISLAGCASITDGTTQTLIFRTDPLETKCKLSRDGVELGSVSGKLNTINVHKGAKDIVVSCEAEGYDSKTLRLVSSTQTAGVVGGVFLDLGITDMLTGAMWKYNGDVNVVLDKSTK